MLAKRIIPCLDVKDGKVVKGIQFRSHQVVGDIVELAMFYRENGADELVFYDITASCDKRRVTTQWIAAIGERLDIPFCVAGGIQSVADAKLILSAGADKISINSPALERPNLISELADEFGSQAVVVGIDSFASCGNYHVYQYTGDTNKSKRTARLTKDWAQEVQALGAGEIVLNCMNQDGMRKGYDCIQLSMLRKFIHVPLIASGGAGSIKDFKQVFSEAHVDGALAASVFHNKQIQINQLKNYLRNEQIEVRL